MNKDVIYIEPEDDITDILVNIKHAKNKIIALVPPKKAGVLHSAVNFKLIAKTAAQRGKTVVLISSDDSLLRLAEKVKMPTAKSLQSKPRLPEMDDAEEFGEGDDDDEDEAEEEKTEKAKEDDAEAEAEEELKKGKETVKKSEDDAEKEDGKKTAGKAAVAAGAKKRPDIDMEIDGDKDDDEEEDDKKSKKKKMVVPNFKKWRWPILLGVLLIAAIIGISYWATNIAPAARITVTVKTTAANFNETVTFVTDETKSDPEKGIFFAQQKTITKQASDDFEATGEVDKGTKATGKITVKVKSPITISLSAQEASFQVPAGTVFTNSAGNKYIASAAATLAVRKDKIDFTSCKISADASVKTCNLSGDVTGDVPLVAEANGEKYNFAAASTGWSFPINSITAVKSSDISGGTSKIVKIVSQADIDKAAINMASDIDSQAREELSAQFGNDFLLISSSFATESSKITTSPAVNEEVTTGVTPKIIKENKYIITAVDKKEVDTYIKKIASDKLGDNTQMIYSTGVAMADGEENKAFFESFKNDNGALSAKLKSTTKSGPRITVEQVMQDSLGKKVGVANSKLRSTKGVQEVKIETSYFFVTTIPEDENKVQIEITVEN